MTNERKIPFEVEIGRVIRLLADQIYQSPLALLRENAQNAFDAILLRRAQEPYEGRIDIDVRSGEVEVRDNGIGMTPAELETNYWRAGASGKDTAEARAAGVVGTFGIGAMANFGIATAMQVETESAMERVRTRSQVERDDLSTTQDCISVESLPATGEPGTRILATLEQGVSIDVAEAERYIAQFVEFVDVPVYVNGTLVSQRPIRSILPSEGSAWRIALRGHDLGGIAHADLEILGMSGGELRVALDDIHTTPESGRPGRAVLLQGRNALRTLRSGFGLATVSVASPYGFGGAIDLSALRPTAGREALDDASNRLLQQLFVAIADVVSEAALDYPESYDNRQFLAWVSQHARFSSCGPLKVRVEPGPQERRLADLKDEPELRYYVGNDQSIISAYASEERPLIVVTRTSPRRDCELGFLRGIGAVEVGDQPQVLQEAPANTLSTAHGAVSLRIASILVQDYFLEAVVKFGTMSHGIPLFVESTTPLTIYLDPAGSSLLPLLQLYDADYDAFGAFAKDFVRVQIFPKVNNLVPSSTRDGAEAFLRRLRSKRELFEIDWTDQETLESIWERYTLGEINLTEAAKRSQAAARSSVIVVDHAATIESVIPAGQEPDQEAENPFGPQPPVDRREAETQALLLTGEQPFNGYKAFVALSDRAQREFGEFFLQPHATSIVWGGQRVLFFFQHHSGRFGLYYDVQCDGLVAESSGGGPYRTSTLLLKDRAFLPIPDEIRNSFVPIEGQKRRLQVRADVLYLESGVQDSGP